MPEQLISMIDRMEFKKYLICMSKKIIKVTPYSLQLLFLTGIYHR